MNDSVKRKIVSPAICGTRDFDPIWGNIIHTYGKNFEADAAYDEMLEEQKRHESAQSLGSIELEANQRGLSAEYEKYLAAGKAQEFMQVINAHRIAAERRAEKIVYFVAGVVVGIVLCNLFF